MRSALELPLLLQRAISRAIGHDCPNIAQSAAYSSIVALFPALIVAAAFIGFLPDTTPIRYELSAFFRRILPSDVTPLLQGYFAASPKNPTSARALITAALVSLSGASSVIATFMEGLRRASDLPEDCWGFWRRRRRALLLVPLSLIPFAIASSLVVFGHFLIGWVGLHISPSVRVPFFVVAILLRWCVALAGSVGLIALLYHMGTPVRQPWRVIWPGALAATAMWFVTTLAFGWYVTRFANYTRVYGSLGAGIALLFWLYIVSLCVLCGAEFNTLYARSLRQRGGEPEPVEAPACPI